VFGLVSRGSGSAGFVGNFPMSFPVLHIDSLNEFLKTGKGVQLVVVDHIIFDIFGESIVCGVLLCLIEHMWLAAVI